MSRKHGKFCTYDRSSLPTCLSAHSLLPAHSSSGYCDIQGRRRVIEDFHSIHLDPGRNISYYLIADGHCGNLASKYVVSFLYNKLSVELDGLIRGNLSTANWQEEIERNVTKVFHEIHEDFLKTAARSSHVSMDQSGTTATVVLLTKYAFVIASLGDSRAVLASAGGDSRSAGAFKAIQLTTDHVASNESEKLLVQARGGYVVEKNGVYRVNGVLAITRSIGGTCLFNLFGKSMSCFLRASFHSPNHFVFRCQLESIPVARSPGTLVSRQ